MILCSFHKVATVLIGLINPNSLSLGKVFLFKCRLNFYLIGDRFLGRRRCPLLYVAGILQGMLGRLLKRSYPGRKMSPIFEVALVLQVLDKQGIFLLQLKRS